MIFLLFILTTSVHSQVLFNDTEAIPPAAYLDDGKLIWGFFSPWALGLGISFAIGLTFTTFVACWTDIGNRSAYGDLVAQRDIHQRNSLVMNSPKAEEVPAPHDFDKVEKPKDSKDQKDVKEERDEKKTANSTELSSLKDSKESKDSKDSKESSSDDSSEETTSLSVESTQSFFDLEDTQIHESSSHLDASEKHARIIQAIYQVSGRDRKGNTNLTKGNP